MSQHTGADALLTHETGMIADIQRYSLHDGPGIRTSVFVKGCNMRCAWCHNPETISFAPEMLINAEKCIGCGQCDDGCFSDARVLCGREMTVDEVVNTVMLDAAYYGDTGGVTLTGGEPSCQAAFCGEVLRSCREKGIHTAIETNLASTRENLLPLLSQTMLIMADLKLYDDDAHQAWTGVSNHIIKQNFTWLADTGLPVIMRTPVIPGVNATESEISAIAAFADTLPNLMYYELRPYHSLGLSKGKQADAAPAVFEKPAPALMQQLGEAAALHCRHVRIAGKVISSSGL